MLIEEQKEELVKMSKERQKIEKDYIDVKAREEFEMRRGTSSRDMAPVGNEPVSERKAIPHTNDIPDVILKPPKSIKRTENKW